MEFIEDYLQHICEKKLDSFNRVDSIYFSIYKQVTKGIGLTDRQYNLIHKKISEYFDISVDVQTKIPMRKIDRSKYIKLVDTSDVYGHDNVYESYKSKWTWIKVRFPFSKKDICKIEKLKYDVGISEYYHSKGSHEHYFKLSYINAFHVCKYFKNTEFDIADDILLYADETKKVLENRDNHVPMLSGNTIINVHDNITNLTKNLTYIQKVDQHIRYGYEIQRIKPRYLIEKIAYRNNRIVPVDPNENSLYDIAKAINTLQRFPLLVLIDTDLPNSSMYEQIVEWHTAFSNFVDVKQQSVLFRVETKDIENNSLNDFVKDKQLNNWVDENTKVVYIKKNKLPKLLIDSFKPICAVSKTATRWGGNLGAYVDHNCDCVIVHETIDYGFYKGRFSDNL